MKKSLKLFLVIIFLFSTTSCVYRIGDFNAISDKNVTLENLKIDYKKTVNKVEGEDCKPTIFFIPTGIPSLEEALDDAMNKGNGNLMLDTALYYSSWSILIFGNSCFTCKGTVYNAREIKK